MYLEVIVVLHYNRIFSKENVRDPISLILGTRIESLKCLKKTDYNNQDCVIHACVLKACISSKYSKYISIIKRILYTTTRYISSSSFVFLFFLFTAMHVKNLAFLRVGVKTIHNTIHLYLLDVSMNFEAFLVQLQTIMKLINQQLPRPKQS